MDPCLATLNELFTTTYRSVLKVEEVMLRHLSNNSLTLSEMHMLECIGKRAATSPSPTSPRNWTSRRPRSPCRQTAGKKGYLTKDRSDEDAAACACVLRKKVAAPRRPTATSTGRWCAP